MNNLPTNLLCGETQTAHFTFKNTGQLPMKNVYLTCSCPRMFAFKFGIGKHNNSSSNNNEKLSTYIVKDNLMTVNEEILNKDYKGIVKVPLADDKLLPGDEVTMEVSVYGALGCGVHEIYFLFYYEPFEEVKNVPYRLLQQMVCIQTLSTLNISTSLQKSLSEVVPGDDEKTDL